MKKMSPTLKTIFSFALLAPLAVSVFAAAPSFINYQGKLTDDTGVPIDGGTLNVVFKFYDSSSNGNVLFTAPTVLITPQKGVFSCLIDVSGNPSLFTQNQTVYLGVKVGSAAEFVERQRLVAAPYALSVLSDSVGSAELKINSVTDEKIVGMSANKLSGNLPVDVIASSVAVNAVGTGQIVDGAVTDAKIAGMSASKLIGAVTATAYSGPVDASQIQTGALSDTVIVSSVAVNAVGTDQIEDGAVTDAKITGVSASKLIGAVTATAYSGPVDASQIQTGALSDTVIASSVAVNAVGTDQIVDGAVTDAKIAGMSASKLIGAVTATAYSGPVDASQIQTGALSDTVIASSVAVNAVGTDQIEDGAVTDAKIAGMSASKLIGAVTATAYSGPVDASQIQTGALSDTVIASSVAVNAVGTDQIVDGAVTDAKIAGMSASKLIGAVTATAYSGPVDASQIQTGALSDTVIASSVAVNAVGTDQIEDGAVTDAKIAGMSASKLIGAVTATAYSGPVDASQIQTGALSDTVIASSVAVNAVGTDQIVDGAVTDAKIAGMSASKLIGAVTATEYSGTVAASQIQPGELLGTVIASSVAVNAVGTDQIQNESVTSEKLGSLAIPYSKIDFSSGIVSNDIRNTVNLYLTNDRRLVIGTSYNSALCGVVNGEARYYNCGYGVEVSGEAMECVEPSPQSCSTLDVIQGFLIKE